MEIPLEDNRAKLVERVQLVQDTAGIIILAPAALKRLHARGILTLLLGLIEIVAILLAVGSAASELKEKPHGSNRVDLSNLFLGIVLLLEYGFAVAAGHKRFSPLLLTALTALFLAFFRSQLQTRLRSRRMIRVDEAGVTAQLSKFRRFHVAWSDVSSIEDAGDVLRLHVRNGKVHELPLRRYANRDEIRSALLTQRGEMMP